MASYISVHDARKLILAHIRTPKETETLQIRDSVGRVLADDVTAPLDWPPFSRAAMDGYAFRAADTPGTLFVMGTLYAGQQYPQPLKRGEAVRIMTGAPLPPGADTVLEQEAVEGSDAIGVFKTVRAGRNVMSEGHEYREGTTILQRNTRIGALGVGQLGALGIQAVTVFKRPRVLIVVTGDEVESPGRPLAPGHIYDANGPLLSALVSNLGARPVVRYSRDQAGRLRRTLKQAPSAFDFVLTTGGVSVGEHDYMPDLLAQDFQRLFWRVDMHPGKATAAGLLAPDVPVLSLSGNPGATLTSWYLLAAPAVAALNAQPYYLTPVFGYLGAPYPKPTRETRFLKARFVNTDTGTRFEVLDNQSSDALRSFAQADGLVVIPHQSPPQPEGQRLSALTMPSPR